MKLPGCEARKSNLASRMKCRCGWDLFHSFIARLSHKRVRKTTDRVEFLSRFALYFCDVGVDMMVFPRSSASTLKVLSLLRFILKVDTFKGVVNVKTGEFSMIKNSCRCLFSPLQLHSRARRLDMKSVYYSRLPMDNRPRKRPTV